MGVAFTVGAAMLLLFEDAFRALEASLSAHVASPFVSQPAWSSRDYFYIWISDERLIGFHVTPECSATILLAPLIILAGGLLAGTRVRWIRTLTGTAVMIAVVLAVNVLRIALIGVFSKQWGMDTGYPIAHTFIGSAIAIIGFALGLAALLLIIGVRPRGKTRP